MNAQPQKLLWIRSIAAFLIFSFLIFLFTHSYAIGLAYGVIGSIIPTTLVNRKESKRVKAIHESWPEIIDHLITGINTGLTLSQSLSELAIRGPEPMRESFNLFHSRLRAGYTFEFALAELHSHFHDPLADQILTIIEFARNVGSRDTVLTLRNLGSVVRSDLALHSELEAKQGWIKNSAFIAALAPWLLLLILGSQHNVAHLYSSPIGIAILVVALLLTAIAFFWMEKVGALPTVPRVFQGESVNYG
jgi:tight adherence protein B